MKYKEKISYAEKVVIEINKNRSIEEITSELKSQGLKDFDIKNIITSAKGIIGENVRPLIRNKLLAKEEILKANEFRTIDAPMLRELVELEVKSIAIEEKKKVTRLLKEGSSSDEIYDKTRQDFYPSELIEEQIQAFQEVKQENSINGRMLSIAGGLVLMLIGGYIVYNRIQNGGSGRLNFLLIAGLALFVKGFFTQKIEDRIY